MDRTRLKGLGGSQEVGWRVCGARWRWQRASEQAAGKGGLSHPPVACGHGCNMPQFTGNNGHNDVDSEAIEGPVQREVSALSYLHYH